MSHSTGVYLWLRRAEVAFPVLDQPVTRRQAVALINKVSARVGMPQPMLGRRWPWSEKWAAACFWPFDRTIYMQQYARVLGVLLHELAHAILHHQDHCYYGDHSERFLLVFVGLMEEELSISRVLLEGSLRAWGLLGEEAHPVATCACTA